MRSSFVFCALWLFATDMAAQDNRPALSQVRTWTYQLDRIDPALIAQTGFDLAVVDYAADGTEQSAFTRGDVARLQRKPDGSRRLVIAYMSIGEAEDYRFYWKPSWRERPPSWLGPENPEWRGNYKVRYWDPEWQRIIYGAPTSYLDRILSAGFDGVYLDIIDAFEYYEDSRSTAAHEMIDFVRDLARYAKAKTNGEFLVLPQNGERLLEHADYLEAIDGVAKEDLFYGYDGAEAFTPAHETTYSQQFLRRARAAGKLVLTVDYASDAATVAAIYERSRANGYVPYASTRDLDRLVINDGLDPPLPRRVLRMRRDLPGQFYALTAPAGWIRLNLGSDYWREQIDPDGSDYTEWTHALAAAYGVGRGWEIGLRVPYVQNVGLGFALAAAYARPSASGDRSLLVTMQAGLPSGLEERRELLFHSLIERYWDRVGVTASFGVSHAEATIGHAFIGLGVQASERVFAALDVGVEGSAARAEASAELVLNTRRSVEFFTARDLTGEARAFAFGVALNTWLGKR